MAIKGNVIQVLWNVMQMLEKEQVEDALIEAFEALADAVHASSGIMWIMDHQSKSIYSIFSTDDINAAGYAIEYGCGLVGQVCESGKEIFVSDAFNDERFHDGKNDITGIITQNVLYYPMLLKGQKRN